MSYTDAKKQLKRIGCARATGDALRAMYASLLPFHCCVDSNVAPKIYTHFQQFADDTAISEAAQAIMRDPRSIFNCF